MDETKPPRAAYLIVPPAADRERERLIVLAGLCPRCGGDVFRPAGFSPDVRGCLCGYVYNPAERAAA